MEPKFQSSFIPQKPIITGLSSTTTATSSPYAVAPNIFSIIATILFVGSLLVSAGLFGYEKLLTSQIAQADKDLVAARNAFELDTIHNLIDISSHISSTKQLLQKHVVISEVFNLLQSLTVKNVRFDSFSYVEKADSLSISMTGEAKNYNTLAAQSAIFLANTSIKNPSFSDFTLTDTGNVTFKFSADIDPSVVSYKRVVNQTSNI